MNKPFKDLTGQRFGSLVASVPVEGKRYRSCMIWLCRCDCGEWREVPSTFLLRGIVKMCSTCATKKMRNVCRENSIKKHRYLHERLHGIWFTMKSRCNNPRFAKFTNYGGRGITVCSEWNSRNGYHAFRKWALSNGYNEDMTIERIDVNGNYCPENCKWIPACEQAYNKRDTQYFVYKGSKIPVVKFVHDLYLDYQCVRNYLNRIVADMDDEHRKGGEV